MHKTADIHLSLSEDLLADVDRVARERGMRRAHILREAIAEYLRGTEQGRIQREMRDYVEALGAFSGEFVQETGSHTAERLLRDIEW